MDRPVRPALGIWVVLLAVLLLASVFFRITITPSRFLDVDELEHLNAAYAVAHGETLYGSLFENHPPLLVWSLQPIVRSQADAEPLIRAARWFVLVPCLGLLGVTARIGFHLSGLGGALAAPLFLLSAVFFFEKGVEVRPDVPGAFFMLLALLLLSWARSQRRSRAWFAAGASLGIALFFTPKALFAAIGMVAGLVAYLGSRAAKPGARESSVRQALGLLGWIGAGTAAAAAVVVAALAVQGSWSGFWRDCVQTSVRMTIDDPGAMRRALLMDSMLRGNPALWLAGAVGAVWSLRPAWQPRGASGTDRLTSSRGAEETGQSAALRWMVAASLATGFAGLFLMGAPLRQYFLFFLPQLALAAAYAADGVVRAVRGTALSFAVALSILAALLIPPWTAIWPVQRQGVELEILRRVLATARPDEKVLDLWSGLYVTRLPAYRYFFLNSDVLRLLPPGQVEDDLHRVLSDPRVTVVIADGHFRLLPPPVQQRIRTEFGLVEDYGFLAVLARRPL